MKSDHSCRALTCREKRAATWFEICVILTILAAMGGLAWLGWQRQQAAENAPKPAPASMP